MLFNSYPFIFFFLPLCLLGYFVLLQWNPIYAKASLLLSSLFFYGYWNINYLPLLLASILINFFIASKMAVGTAPSGGGEQEKEELGEDGAGRWSRKAWLTLGISFNLLLLGFFKYTDFFLENFNLFSYFLLGASSLSHSPIPLPHLILPLAISFFTFQQIAYLCDAYRGCLADSLLDYALFVSFFPQLIAGPIVNHKEMMPQFHTLRPFKIDRFTRGLFLFSVGLFKKVVLADGFALYADNGFSASLQGTPLNFFESWLTALSYTFQLYFDFSGYCDMAMGLALFFGIRLPINFNSPYQALNIQEFWKRWHITLGQFLSQYLYRPLGGSQRGRIKTLRNIGIVFLLSGLWHGAGWGFVIWGALHAMAMILHRVYGYCLEGLGFHAPQNLPYKVLCWILTFGFVTLSWVFFRAETLPSALNLLKGMAGGYGIVLPDLSDLQAIEKWLKVDFPTYKTISDLLTLMAMIGFSALLIFWHPNSTGILRTKHFHTSQILLYSFLFALSLLQMLGGNQTSFLYFNF